jgi:alkaline phosphatase
MRGYKIIVLLISTFALFAFYFSSCRTIEQHSTPKNIILLISDGCGFNQINATSLYQYGETGLQVYEKFPVRYAMSTYSATSEGYNPQQAWQSFKYALNKPTDSAASGTAMATGFKSYNGAVSVDTNKKEIQTIAEKAEELDKSSGVVTSVLFSHATPACFAAHDSSRGNYKDIAQDMILGSRLDVIMGCGHPLFDGDGKETPDTSYRAVGGMDLWMTLIEGSAGNDADGDGEIDYWTLIQDRDEFQALMQGDTPKRVIGIPKVRSTLQVARTGEANADPFSVPFLENIPNLAEITTAALNILDNNQNGFFLMIEGGAVDWACHANNSGRMIEEEIDFNNAVESVVDWVDQNSNWNETLIIVTGDHETGYLNGPGSGSEEALAQGGIESVWRPVVNNGKGKLPGMEWHSGGHSNSLIPLFAKGSGSELFHQYADEVDPVRGKYVDNTEIARVMFRLWGGLPR